MRVINIFVDKRASYPQYPVVYNYLKLGKNGN